jgi:hypothetical protein
MLINETMTKLNALKLFGMAKAYEELQMTVKSGELSMNYYHPILTRSDERASVWMEFRDSTRESSPLSTPRPVPDPTPCSVHQGWLTRKINASNFSGSQRSAFTTSQASNAFSVRGLAGGEGRRPDR